MEKKEDALEATTTGSASGDQGELRLTHIDERGEARMVDVGEKAVTRRFARAGGRVYMNPQTMALLQRQALPKGDVLSVARIAGVMAAKRTSELIPLCHPLALTHVEVEFDVRPEELCVDIQCTARTEGKTGVEMEALTGASVAALTIYDMCKAVDKGMIISEIRLLEKTGGKEDYVRKEERMAGSDAAGTVSPSAGAPAPGGELPAEDQAQDLAALLCRRGRVLSLNVSPGKGERKKPVERTLFVEEHGIEGDGHAGPWHRQVSLLGQESIDKMVAKGLDVAMGDFAENVTTVGVELTALPIGTRMEIGPTLLEVTQIGKVCHERCAIFYQAGDCVMPREGIFVRVLQGGEVVPGDEIRVVELPTGAGPAADEELAAPAEHSAGEARP